MSAPTRLRIRYSKLGKIRFTSHRDVARIWERSLRRAGLPLAYTEGFTPRPKLSFGLALSTGYESLGEYLDVAVRPEAALPESIQIQPLASEPPGRGGICIDLDSLPAQLAAGLPAGIEVQAVVALPPGAASLQQAVTSCTWHIDIEGAGPSAVAEALEGALAKDELPLTRERKGRPVTDDVRPAIAAARVLGPTDPAAGPGARIEAELTAQTRALRPAELVAAVAPTGSGWRLRSATRVHQWTQAGGARRELIELPPAATPPPHAKARAS